jgi:hypothetical protein
LRGADVRDADERRRDDLVPVPDLDLAGRDPEQRVTVDDEPRPDADATPWPTTSIPTLPLRETHPRV